MITLFDILDTMRCGGGYAAEYANMFYMMHAGIENKTFMNAEDAKVWLVKLSNVTDNFVTRAIEML